MSDYNELNNGVFHQTLFLPNKGQSNAEMARLDDLFLSPTSDTSLVGNSLYTYVQVQIMSNGIFLWVVSAVWAWLLGEFPKSWDAFTGSAFWKY